MKAAVPRIGWNSRYSLSGENKLKNNRRVDEILKEVIISVTSPAIVSQTIGPVYLADKLFGILISLSKVETLLSRKTKIQLLVSSIVVGTAFLIHWLIFKESSPFYDYLCWHVNFRNIWVIINIIPFIVSALVGAFYYGNPDAYSIVGFVIPFIVQWFVIGFFLSIPIVKYLRSRQRI
jgi:hypothetical protein